MDYLKRIADEELSLRLEAFGAVQINGLSAIYSQSKSLFV